MTTNVAPPTKTSSDPPSTMNVWYLIINSSGEPIGSGNPDNIEILPGKSVADLKTEIHNKNKNKLKEVDPPDLVIWRCKDIDMRKESSNDLKASIASFSFSDDSEDVEDINPRDTVGGLVLDCMETLLVQTPATHIYLNALCIDTDKIVLKPVVISMPLVERGRPTIVADLVGELRIALPRIFFNRKRPRCCNLETQDSKTDEQSITSEDKIPVDCCTGFGT